MQYSHLEDPHSRTGLLEYKYLSPLPSAVLLRWLAEVLLPSCPSVADVSLEKVFAKHFSFRLLTSKYQLVHALFIDVVLGWQAVLRPF